MNYVHTRTEPQQTFTPVYLLATQLRVSK